MRKDSHPATDTCAARDAEAATLVNSAASPVLGRWFREYGTFCAFDAAVGWLESLGYSVGRMQRGAPCGIMFGDFDIAKWRNLSALERAELDGAVEGNFRDGPVYVRFSRPAPVSSEPLTNAAPSGARAAQVVGEESRETPLLPSQPQENSRG